MKPLSNSKQKLSYGNFFFGPNSRLIRLLSVCLILCSSAACRSVAADSPLKVFVLAGQSNMVGKRAIIAELPASLQVQQENLFFTKSGRWIPLEPGKTEPKGFGPELSFATELSEKLGEPIGIIKVSQGGTNLAEDWNPEDKNAFYAKMLKLVNKAKKSRPVEIKGMVWVQGGADAKRQDHANAYATNLEELIARCRSDFGSPEMAFVCERIRKSGGEKKPYMSIIREAHQSCPADNYIWIDSDDYEKGEDNVHYTASGLVALGRDSAKAMLELLSQEQIPANQPIQ